MRLRFVQSLFLALTLVVLGACGSPEQPASPADTTADGPAVAAEATESATDLNAVKQSVEKTVEETAEEPAATSGEAIELTEAAPAAAADKNTEWQYSEGKHFRRLTTSQGTSSPPDKIEVAEFFWYGCPHCYDFDPIISQWKNKAPADVAFVRIPVIWNPTNQIHGRIMYTAEALGLLDKMHSEIFNSIHQKKVMLTEDADIIALFKQFGVDEAKFREAYGSFGVTSALKRAENLTRRYGIRSVPILVVNGKYVTEGSDIRNFDDILSITNELIERERQNQ